jgi:hypothetical protein
MSWKSKAPIETVDRLLQVLFTQIEQLCIDKFASLSDILLTLYLNQLWHCRGVTHEEQILEFLKQGTLVGLLPPPHTIMLRVADHGPSLNSTGFYSYFWSVIYLRFVHIHASLRHVHFMTLMPSSNLTPPIWHGTHVKLFKVRSG